MSQESASIVEDFLKEYSRVSSSIRRLISELEDEREFKKLLLEEVVEKLCKVKVGDVITKKNVPGTVGAFLTRTRSSGPRTFEVKEIKTVFQHFHCGGIGCNTIFKLRVLPYKKNGEPFKKEQYLWFRESVFDKYSLVKRGA